MNLGNKGLCKQWTKSGKRSNNSKDNRTSIKASSSISKKKICLSSTIQIHWNLRDGNDNIFLALWLQSTIAWTLLKFALILNWILLCSSPLLNMHVPPKSSPSWITAMLWWGDLHNSKKQGHPRWTGRSGEFWQNMVHLQNEMAKHSKILATRTPWTIWKGKTIWYWKMSTSQVRRYPIY